MLQYRYQKIRCCHELISVLSESLSFRLPGPGIFAPVIITLENDVAPTNYVDFYCLIFWDLFLGTQSKPIIRLSQSCINRTRKTTPQTKQEQNKMSKSITNSIPTFTTAEGTESDTSSISSSSSSSPWADVEVMEPHVGYKKVLVTGGAGFIGSHVAEHLLERGDDVVIIDEMNDYYDVRIKESNLRLLTEKYGENRVAVYKGDICDAELMENLFEKERPRWICHMAARAGVRPSIQDPFVYIHSNIQGTTQLMELANKYGVQNFVFASSSSVYGGSRSIFFSEDEVVDNPVSPYAASKKACELMAYTYHHLYKLNVTGLRFFTVYGPRGRPDMAPFKFIDRVSRGIEIQQFGDGSSSRDYTYISDIVDGVVRAIDRPHPYQIFNLGKGEGTSLKEFIALVEKYTGKMANRKIVPDQPGDVPYTCADVRKAEKLLGYRSEISFEDGISRTAEWYRQAYSYKGNDICPETQANGLARSPSFTLETSTAC
jgi:UDP-glucuronate 4-epimerase